MSQRLFARALGFSAHSNLVQYELGRRIPPPDIVVAFERMFGDGASGLRRLRAEALAVRAHAVGAPATVPGGAAPPAGDLPRRAVPAMLPATIPDFTGRAHELRRLHDLTQWTRQARPAGPMIIGIAGTAGVGKTALAVHFAHQVREHFPDGQLFVNLCGYARTPPRQPVQVLAGLLQSLGVTAEQVPPDEEAAIGLYRSLVADRRLLLVLDNARDAAQTRPLVPAGDGCLVVVTSRDRLTGLTARDGAHRIPVDVLGAGDSHALLARVLGTDRVAGEAAAVAELARACAHLPLALRIAAANLSNHPRRRIGAYLAELAGGNRLAELQADGDDDSAVRLAFDASYTALSPAARRTFRLLGLIPGPDVTVAAAAELAGTPRSEARQLLDRLAAAHLITEHRPGRYSFHDLLRLYATERAGAEDDEDTRSSALRRLLAWYLHRADDAARLLYPHVVRLSPPAPSSPAGPAGFADRAAASAWLDAEMPNLTAAVSHAAEHGPPAAAWLLADTLRSYFINRVHAADWPATARAALRAATTGGDLRARAVAELSLADCLCFQRRYRSAVARYSRVLTLARRADWTLCQATALNHTGNAYMYSGRLQAAVDHYARALALHRQVGLSAGVGRCLNNLGEAYQDLGRLAEAAEHHAEALVAHRRIGFGHGLATVFLNLGRLAHLSGQPTEAIDRLTRALTLIRESGDLVDEAYILLSTAAVRRDVGHHAEAVRAADAALVLAVESGDVRCETRALNTLGTIWQSRGDEDAAAAHHRQALDRARQAGDRRSEIEALLGLAATGRRPWPETAHTWAGQARTIARRYLFRLHEGAALTSLATTGLVLGRARHAAQVARQAVDIHRAAGHPVGEARALLALGNALRAGGDVAAARAAWAPALALFTAVGAPEAERVRALL